MSATAKELHGNASFPSVGATASGWRRVTATPTNSAMVASFKATAAL